MDLLKLVVGVSLHPSLIKSVSCGKKKKKKNSHVVQSIRKGGFFGLYKMDSMGSRDSNASW